MSTRIALRCTKENNSFNAYYFSEFISRWFDLQVWNDNNGSNQPILFGMPFDCKIIVPALQHGCKIIVDNLQEAHIPDLVALRPWTDQVLILNGSDQRSQHFSVVNVVEWFWYFESPWYHARGYSDYAPQHCADRHNFFMPMRLQRRARDQIIDLLADNLNQAIWSYVAKGRRLPGIPPESVDDQRWFEPAWYDSTWFSLVNESQCEDNGILFWTEKTCKPLAFFHPFLTIAQPGLLARLREFGFETWPEVFDETYDTMPHLQDRMQHIAAQVQEFDSGKIQQRSVQHKMQHNHDLFFNLDLVYKKIEQRVISPILEFLETRV